MEWQVNAVHKYIGDEALFLREFEKEMAEAQSRRVPGGDWQGTSPKSCFWRVYQNLKVARESATAVKS